MKGNFNVTIQGFETKVDNVPVKVSEISISGYGERSWFDMLIVYRFVKHLPTLCKKLIKVSTEIQ